MKKINIHINHISDHKTSNFQHNQKPQSINPNSSKTIEIHRPIPHTHQHTNTVNCIGTPMVVYPFRVHSAAGSLFETRPSFGSRACFAADVVCEAFDRFFEFPRLSRCRDFNFFDVCREIGIWRASDSFNDDFQRRIKVGFLPFTFVLFRLFTENCILFIFEYFCFVQQ